MRAKSKRGIIYVYSRHAIVRIGLTNLLSKRGYQLEPLDSISNVKGSAMPSLAIVDVGGFILHPDGWTPPVPDADVNVHLLGFSFFTDWLTIRSCLSAGYKGFVFGQSTEREIIQATETVMAGKTYFDDETANRIFVEWQINQGKSVNFKGRAQLTKREFEIVQMIGAGKTNKSIAKTLGLSVKTVETHKGNIKQKLGLASSMELSELSNRVMDL